MLVMVNGSFSLENANVACDSLITIQINMYYQRDLLWIFLVSL